MHRALAMVAGSLVGLIASATGPLAPSVAAPNDNRQSAGSLTTGVLTLDLEARAAT